MEVICLEDLAFYNLIEQVVQRISEKKNVRPDKWLSGEEAMQRLKVSSRSTLQKLRDEGKIRYSQPEKKYIVYDAQSIDDYLEKHAKNTF